ncbi:MAG: hypothetical protein DSZ09_05810 [Sulfurovum sp.]|nr:MAG: hypothetical protein DSZ09_05810 [Sulfurovum sp.]
MSNENTKYDKQEKKIEYITVFSVLMFFALFILFLLRGCDDSASIEMPVGKTTHLNMNSGTNVKSKSLEKKQQTFSKDEKRKVLKPEVLKNTKDEIEKLEIQKAVKLEADRVARLKLKKLEAQQAARAKQARLEKAQKAAKLEADRVARLKLKKLEARQAARAEQARLEKAQKVAKLEADRVARLKLKNLEAQQTTRVEEKRLKTDGIKVNSKTIKTEASEEAGIINDIQSQSISASPYILKGVYFQTSSSKLSNDKSRRQLDVIANTLKKYPSVKVILRGHTDNKGNDKINKILSEKRALSVKNALIQRGIAPERITAKGMSDTQPIETNDTEEGRALNRRVDIATI